MGYFGYAPSTVLLIFVIISDHLSKAKFNSIVYLFKNKKFSSGSYFKKDYFLGFVWSLLMNVICSKFLFVKGVLDTNIAHKLLKFIYWLDDETDIAN